MPLSEKEDIEYCIFHAFSFLRGTFPVRKWNQWYKRKMMSVKYIGNMKYVRMLDGAM